MALYTNRSAVTDAELAEVMEQATVEWFNAEAMAASVVAAYRESAVHGRNGVMASVSDLRHTADGKAKSDPRYVKACSDGVWHQGRAQTAALVLFVRTYMKESSDGC